MSVLLRALITLLCGVGLYASLFMLFKLRRAERGELTEPSVVQNPRAKLYGGVPNSVFGVAYYAALAVVCWLPLPAWAAAGVLLAVALAAGTSFYLAYTLLFVTRATCPYCWTAHAVNCSLLVAVPWLFKIIILSNGQ
ncbi:MAG: hypothetical protein JO199_04185 [Candidatus Eremiobacteraeota bacterium]|nr:hypothetical protein [Candidatus Eremiobacteraeota bacterium]